jgi:uncharacterized membrane protein
MSKATVTKLFIGAAITIVAGAVLVIAAVWIAIVNDVFVMSDNQVVGVHGSGIAWSMLGLGTVGVLTLIGGMIVGFVSWIGALMNTSQLENRSWFLALLLLGIFSFGFVAMIAYIIAGPDATAEAQIGPVPSTT